MIGLTDKQKRMLNFIENFCEREGMAPTVYELADAFNVKTSTIFAHIKALQRKGEITRSSKARSIILTRPKPNKAKHMSFVLPIPLLGRINAGLPAESLEHKECDVYCDNSIIKSNELDTSFALRVDGESMRDLGIIDGDVVIVKKAQRLKDGDIVVALVDAEATVKSYYSAAKGQIELRPANSEFKSQFYPKNKVIIQGKVVALQRKY